MPIEHTPFQATRLEEEREQGGQWVTIRLNEQEREQLDQYRQDNGIIKDSSAYKHALIIARNVTHGLNMMPKTSTSVKKKISFLGKDPGKRTIL